MCNQPLSFCSLLNTYLPSFPIEEHLSGMLADPTLVESCSIVMVMDSIAIFGTTGFVTFRLLIIFLPWSIYFILSNL